jgi:hypothetical protein
VTSQTDALWAPLVEHGSSWCAPNVHAEAQWLDVEGDRWRLAVTRHAAANSYVVSATGQYVDYAADEIRRLTSRSLRLASHLAVTALRPVLTSLDPIVILDALPVSTVLHESRSAAAWKSALQATREKYPTSPIVVRSLDEVHAAPELNILTALGFARVFSRQVFHQDPRTRDFWQIRNIRHDVRLGLDAPLYWRAVTVADATVVSALYWQLYGEKHSTLNPQFTAQWIAEGLSTGALHGEAIELGGRLVAVFLSYRVGAVITNPIFGYDTTLPQSLGLYRRLTIRTLHVARENGWRVHASSGAPGFKASRGGEAVNEYHCVHLSNAGAYRQRLAWRVLRQIANRIGPGLVSSAV